MANLVSIPFDPADLDRIPPDDLDSCDVCMGEGLVYAGYDATTGKHADAPCNRCHGTGSLPILGGAA